MVDNQSKLNPEALAQKIDQLFSEYDAQTHGYLDIAVIGAVSSGKSSFLNAFFDCSREDIKFSVSALSGTTKEVEFQQIGSHIKILDTPGLQDINKANVEKTEKLLSEGVDIGILIIADVANEQDLDNYKLLKKTTGNTFVVLNKVDRETKGNLKKIKAQWREFLQLDPNTEIYEVCCRGYDLEDKFINPITGDEQEIPVDEYGVPKTIRGIQFLQGAIFAVCFKVGKVAFIAKELKRKQPAAIGIISAACAASVGAILLPGSIAYILTSQATAISSLGYLYKGEFPSNTEVAGIMKIFSSTSAQSIGAVAYGLFLSFLPPTGVLDIPGIILIVSYMATTLLIVNFLFSKGLEIKKSAGLEHEFKRINKSIQSSITTVDFREVAKVNFWTDFLSSIEVNIEN
ncbi:MAG: GTPase domain-containing protein [Planktothrix sp.]|uniref:GTPase domain-containing protein n=2 Tax=Planktothrix sp. TaxID=3088171 RepID=UPI0038D37784